MPNLRTPKQKLIDEILTLLGNNIVDVDDHLTTKDIKTTIVLALEKYRQRAANATEESVAFLTLQPDTQEYTLPKETIEVRELFRRGLSPAGNESIGNQFDPFNVAYTNLYLLQSGGSGGLLTWELYNQFLETTNRLFGGHYNFTWNSHTKKLRIIRNHKITEEVLLWLYLERPDDSILTDIYAGPWIRGYTLALCKMILGQAYEKFSQLIGPQGGVTLNGASLKAESVAEMAQLEEDLKNYTDGSTPLGWIIG